MRKFSKSWLGSRQPRKQRKFRHHSPLHIRQKLLSAHLDKRLREEFKRRSLPVRRGDEVLVMRGEFKDQRGNISKVDLKNICIFVENIKKKKVSGQEIQVPIDPSNVKITKLNMDDKRRRKFLDRKELKENKKVEKK